MVRPIPESEPACASLVALRELSKVYQEGERQRVVLRDLTIDFQSGEFIVVLGRSGCGKSTLLNLISGIDLPTSGEVVVDGVSLTGLSETERTLFRRRHIGFVFQFFNLIPTLTVEENLFLPLELNNRLDAEACTVGHELLAEVGLADRSRSY
ncbi:MAG: ABC transporter ATP-binding protein, partial [Acidiferrobacterales bacterium]